MLCTEVLNGLSGAMRMMKFDVGKDYDVLTISFDPREKPDLAAAKKRAYLQRYGRPDAQNYWHFLTGDEKNIRALTDTVGFHYQWDPKMQQFAHAAGIIVLTPEGRVSKYFYGVEYSPKDLRLGLVDASQNCIGSVVDQVLLYCYHYDPRTGKYGAVITRVLQLAGGVTVIILGGFLIFLFRHEPKKQPSAIGSSLRPEQMQRPPMLTNLFRPTTDSRRPTAARFSTYVAEHPLMAEERFVHRQPGGRAVHFPAGGMRRSDHPHLSRHCDLHPQIPSQGASCGGAD
jgi:hypothetical protein